MRFRLRTLATIVTLLCIGLALFQYIASAASRQRAIAWEVWNSGGFVFYDYQCLRDESTGLIKGYGPEPLESLGSVRKLLIDWFGVDNVERVVLVTYFHYFKPEQAPFISRNTLEAISELHSLEDLEICGVKSIDDSAIEILARMKQLRCLDVSGTNITEAGVLKLRAALPNTEVTTD